MTTTDVRDLGAIVKQAREPILKVKEEMARVIVGQENLLSSLMIALLADGHILLEGLPGLAKTLAATTLAKAIDCEYTRIQFTPDLLPADLLGTSIYNPKEGTFHVKKGPVFTNIVLGDEINRAPAKVQSALLEVMQEKQVTIGGETFQTGNPFLVIATQNPIEQEGTYPLPEAQTDRFMLKVLLTHPTKEQEWEVMKRMASFDSKPEAKKVINAQQILSAREVVDQIYIDDKVTEYLLSIVFATREPEKYNVDIVGLLEFGASPRATLAFTLCGKARAFLDGRGYVTPQDIKSSAHEILRHRIALSYEAEAESITTDLIIDRILDTLLVP